MANTLEIHPPSSILHPPFFLAGPTAVGKSAVALTLAEALGGEIISVDSMQVYRGLDLGTAKPTAAERARVPHHLIDICDLREAFDAAQFVRRAQSAMAEIQARGRTPVFCGGTGLYFTALLAGLGEAPPADDQLRAQLAAAPLDALLAELQERDPATFDTIDRKNPRRVRRAIEVIRLTGKPFSDQRAVWESGPAAAGSADIPVCGFTRLSSPVSVTIKSSQELATGKSPEPEDRNVCPTPRSFCLTRQGHELRQRIHARVDEMFARGLVEETRRLLAHGLAENQTAMQAIGYRQVVEHLRGERGLAETIELVKTRTRKFAKRQLTWFRRHGNCQWIELQPGETPPETMTRIIGFSDGHRG